MRKACLLALFSALPLAALAAPEEDISNTLDDRALKKLTGEKYDVNGQLQVQYVREISRQQIEQNVTARNVNVNESTSKVLSTSRETREEDWSDLARHWAEAFGALNRAEYRITLRLAESGNALREVVDVQSLMTHGPVVTVEYRDETGRPKHLLVRADRVLEVIEAASRQTR